MQNRNACVLEIQTRFMPYCVVDNVYTLNINIILRISYQHSLYNDDFRSLSGLRIIIFFGGTTNNFFGGYIIIFYKAVLQLIAIRNFIPLVPGSIPGRRTLWIICNYKPIHFVPFSL